jgi:hypothetical protein
VRLPRRHSGILLLVKPDRGYTRADLRADDRRRTPAANRRIRNNLRFFGGVEVRRGGSGVLWETLYAGRYWLVGLSTLKGFSIKTVHVHGTPLASSFPRVSANIELIDRGRIRVDRTIPQAGRMLIRNSSHRIDAVFFLPIRRGVSYREFLRAVRHDRFPIRPPGFTSTAQLSANAGFVLRYRLQPGPYVAMGIKGVNSLIRPRHRRLRQLLRPVRVDGTANAGTHLTQGLTTNPSVGAPAHDRDTPSDIGWPGWATSQNQLRP